MRGQNMGASLAGDWDRYAWTLRANAGRAAKQYPKNLTVQALSDHIPMLLDEIDALRHDIQRAYDIANGYLNDTIRLRRELASAIEAATAGETTKIGSTEGESATRDSEDAQGRE